MCGIGGIVSLTGEPIDRLDQRLQRMSDIVAHRGPDGAGQWRTGDASAGFIHRRLSIIDLSPRAAQPMVAPNETVIVHNGEIYNYPELRDEFSRSWTFATTSDTETVLAAYDNCLDDFPKKLRGMFASAIWDNKRRRLIAARDRFGIKPFYYMAVNDILYFASEAKALLPFVPSIETDPHALAQYLTFQYCLGEETLFKHIKQLLPGHILDTNDGRVRIRRYWDVAYEIDYDHSPQYFYRRLKELIGDSLRVHVRSDVPIGSYMSGGIDSSLVASLSSNHDRDNRDCFHGKFTQFPGYDESHYAEDMARRIGAHLHQVDITARDFSDNIEDIIYHLDYPVAGPGSFPQYIVSQLASRYVKVVLGGQGGDEVFGGYARYLVAYFEQCIKAALDGTYKNGHYVVTIESIIPNLGILREYKPMIQSFWREGLFGELDERYFHLIDRSSDMTDEVEWGQLDKGAVFEQFRQIFNNKDNVQKEAYLDKMTHFDFKCLLPALLQVEDRMSMAHGLESRVPLLDHPIIEFAATIPADVKFQGGNMKHLLKTAFADTLPVNLLERRDKMGFPVPLKEWFQSDLKCFVMDTFASKSAQTRPFMNHRRVLESFSKELRFSRKTWGLLSLELWQRKFHDRSAEWRFSPP